jgi:hypothetical protein
MTEKKCNPRRVVRFAKGQSTLGKALKHREYSETVAFLLHIPVDIWTKFIKTVPISRTRHDFIIDLIQRRIWEYEKATMAV